MTVATSTEELAALVQHLTTQVEELHQRLDQAGGFAGSAASGAEGVPTLRFGTVEDWVVGLLLPMYSWRVDGQRWFWCERWWMHPEAIWRLELLWRGWESARLQPIGMSGWSLELDHHLRELCGDEGPFRQCRADEGDRTARHVDPEVASARLAPAGWWDEPPSQQQS